MLGNKAQQHEFWVPDSAAKTCFKCGTTFTFVNRRHHCRACGRIFCGHCVRKTDLTRHPKDGAGGIADDTSSVAGSVYHHGPAGAANAAGRGASARGGFFASKPLMCDRCIEKRRAPQVAGPDDSELLVRSAAAGAPGFRLDGTSESALGVQPNFDAASAVSTLPAATRQLRLHPSMAGGAAGRRSQYARSQAGGTAFGGASTVGGGGMSALGGQPNVSSAANHSGGTGRVARWRRSTRLRRLAAVGQRERWVCLHQRQARPEQRTLRAAHRAVGP